MKACVLHGIEDIRCEQVTDPVIGEDEVLVKVQAAGICGSDMGRVYGKGAYHYPIILGHEFSGEIVEVSQKEDEPLLGRRTAVFPLLPCMHCAACSVGEYAQCSSYDYYGSRRDGGFAEYLAVKKWNLVFVPDGVSFEEAAMCEPVAVGIHALSQAGIRLGDTVVIFGAGTIGLILAKIASVWGASDVILFDIDEKKIQFARSLGFSHCFDSGKISPEEIVGELTEGKGADVTVEGTGAQTALNSCLEVASVFGKVVLMGNPLREMRLKQNAYWEILRKQLTLRGTWNSSYNGTRNDWKTALRAMPGLRLKELISDRFRLEDCREAFEAMRARDRFTVKVMFVNA